MKEAKATGIKIPPMHQMGTAVKSVDSVIANYWKYFGIGPWVILKLDTPDIFERTYHGKPSEYKARAALTYIGKFQLEVMQNLEGETTYGDFVADKGEGPHHLQYLVDKLDTLNSQIDSLLKLGFKSEMSARTGASGGFHYINTVSKLKTIWEPVRKPDEIHEASERYPVDKNAVSDAKLKISSISQIALVVKNLEEVMKSYSSILGIGPWKVTELASPALHSISYHGKPGNFTARLAVADTGIAQLALIQPLSGKSAYADWLDKRGEGIHHIQFVVDDIKKTTAIMNNMGFATLMSGGIEDGAFALYDTMDAVKCLWEAYQPPKNK